MHYPKLILKKRCTSDNQRLTTKCFTLKEASKKELLKQNENHKQNLEKYIVFLNGFEQWWIQLKRGGRSNCPYASPLDPPLVSNWSRKKIFFLLKIKHSIQKQLSIKSKELEQFQSNLTAFKIEIKKKAESQVLNELNAYKIKSSFQELDFER